MSLPPFQSFLSSHADEVHRLLVAIAGPQEAADAFQETFLSALRAYPDLPADTDLGAWVATIAARKGIDVHRRRTRQAIPVAEPPAPGVEPDEPWEGTGDGTLWEQVRRLPDKQRVAVGGRFGADLSYERLAELLGCSQDAARRSVHEGLTKLRERIGPGGGRRSTSSDGPERRPGERP